ncbi:HNH endonuclease signature motif containing protein [Nakamurella endophytica]|uniref:DUF222 domain-containing protein n=1 Tax=Nakamurella endophytica TaxID=1748367 RepID=A0A917WKV7_9ACTN|nr:HNH endonuclease signature motif containing protein [Nakamurella endophytica]GGM11656.1 hypothetical protein GCM10011594_34490 [Nakamurella endophytica]
MDEDGLLRPAAPGWEDERWVAVRNARTVAASAHELLQTVVDTERLLSHLQARQAQALAALAVPGCAGDVSDLVDAFLGRGPERTEAVNPEAASPDLARLETLVAHRAEQLAAAEVGLALGVSPLAAGRRVRSAVELVTELPGTHAALRDGLIDRVKAWVIADRTCVLSPEERVVVEDRVLPLAGSRTASRLRTLTDRAVISVDPAAAEERARRARRSRDVLHRPLQDGLGGIDATLPAEGAIAVATLVDMVASAWRGDGRSAGERRADALTDVAEALLGTGYLDLRDLLPPSPAPPIAAGAADASVAVAQPPGQSSSAESCPTRPAHAAARRLDCELGGIVTGWSGGPSVADAEQASHKQGNGQVVEAPIRSSAVLPPPLLPAVGSRLASEPQNPADSREEDLASMPDTYGDTFRSSSAADIDAERPTSVHPALSRPTRQGRPVDLVVTMSLATLAALDDEPAHLEGHGAVTAGWARILAQAARSVTILVTDPSTTAAIGVGDRTYRPRQRLRDRVISVDRQCVWPGCSAPAWRCDLDHRTPFDHARPDRGGPTAAGNLDPLCRQHHVLKTHGGWDVQRRPDRTVVVTSPAGRRTSHPPVEFGVPAVDAWIRPPRSRPEPSPSAPSESQHPGTRTPAVLATPATATATLLLDPPF